MEEEPTNALVLVEDEADEAQRGALVVSDAASLISNKGKGSITERMAALRKRKHDRAMERREAQVEAGVDPERGIVTTVSSPAVVSLPERELPQYETVEQWEEYFGDLAAAGCDDQITLSPLELSLLAVHGAYSTRIEEFSEKMESLPHFWSPADVEDYCNQLQQVWLQ